MPPTATDGAAAPEPAEHDPALVERASAGMALAHWAARDPDRLAVVDGDRTVSFAELNGAANALARALRDAGLRPDDGVALLGRNRLEWVQVWAATQRAGLYLTPVNWHLTEADAGYVVANCEARALVADAALGGSARAVAAATDRLAVRWSIGGDIDGFTELPGILTGVDVSDLNDPEPGAVMMYTSGTTGRPKGVRRPRTPPRITPLVRYSDGDVNLCTGPLYHAGPLVASLLDPLTQGATVVLTEGFDAERTLQLVERHRVTHLHLVPTMFVRLLHLPEAVRRRYDVSSLKVVVHGAAPCPRWVKAAMIDWWGPVLVEYYSATEGFGCMVTTAEWLQRPGTVGRPTAGQVLVGDDDASPLPAGEIGLVWLRPLPGQRFAYFKDGDKTDRTWRGDYFTLGDVGYLDEDGYLFLTDRSADLVISGGVNVYPSAVDAVLLAHPAVADVATIGMPDPEWGERLLAVVQLQPHVVDTPQLRAEVLAFGRERLAGFQCPREIDVVAELPRQDNGKVYRRQLRERYRAERAGHRLPPPVG